MTLCVLFCLSSCGKKKEELIQFEHRLFSLKYPSSWIKVDNDELVLGIKKNTVLKAEFEGENRNILISAIDTTGMHSYGYSSVKEYALAFQEYQKENNPKWELKSGLDSMIINNIAFYTSSYDVASKYKLTGGEFIQSQTHYHFESLNSYILVALTTPKGYPKEDVYQILYSISRPEFEPLDGLLKK